MPPIRCFWLEPTTRVARYLRRYEALDYAAGQKGSCGPRGAVHDARVRIDDAEVEIHPDGTSHLPSGDGLWPRDDPRWPTVCDACGRPFAEGDHWQLFVQRLYCRVDTGDEMTLQD